MSQIESGASQELEARPADRISVEAVARLNARPNTPTNLVQARLAGWAAYQAIPMPTNRDEEWRRTDIRPLQLEAVNPVGEESAFVSDVASLPRGAQTILAGEGGRAGLIVQRNSSSVYLEKSQELQSAGVIFSSIEDLARDNPALFDRYFMTEAVKPDEKFAALHAAFVSGGSFVFVPKGKVVDLPIQSLFWGDSSHGAIFPHTLIVAEENSELTFIDQYASAEGALGGKQGFVSGAVEIIAKPGARVRYVNLQEWGSNVWSFNSIRAIVEGDATVDTLVAAFGGALSKARVQTALSGRGSHSQMLGILFGSLHQHFDHHTLQDHIAPNTTSDLLYKTTLKDSARSVFSGLIRAHRQAQKTDAVQTNRNLLLSRHSRADSIPNLEIEANDLRCTHAAAIAPIDPEQVFYLRSRGMSKPDATRLIVEGFFEPLLEKIPLASVRERLREVVTRRVSESEEQ